MKEHYEKKCKPEFEGNVMDVPRMVKIVVSSSGASDKKEVAYRAETISLITGQQAVVTKVARAEAAFKIRRGWPIGAMVTLRGEKMYQFYEKLVYFVLPRLRDFQGLSNKSFDGQGNYNLGMRDQSCFPEIKFEQIQSNVGLNITIVIASPSAKKSEKLLRLMHFPFKENHHKQEA